MVVCITKLEMVSKIQGCKNKVLDLVVILKTPKKCSDFTPIRCLRNIQDFSSQDQKDLSEVIGER